MNSTEQWIVTIAIGSIFFAMIVMDVKHTGDIKELRHRLEKLEAKK